jgi:hypothetical protein
MLVKTETVIQFAYALIVKNYIYILIASRNKWPMRVF